MLYLRTHARTHARRVLASWLLAPVPLLSSLNARSLPRLFVSAHTCKPSVCAPKPPYRSPNVSCTSCDKRIESDTSSRLSSHSHMQIHISHISLISCTPTRAYVHAHLDCQANTCMRASAFDKDTCTNRGCAHRKQRLCQEDNPQRWIHIRWHARPLNIPYSPATRGAFESPVPSMLELLERIEQATRRPQL